MEALRFPSESWAVFNGHINNASNRAMAICEQVFNPDNKWLLALKQADKDGIMAIFNDPPNPVTQLYGHACLIFANGLDKTERTDADVYKNVLRTISTLWPIDTTAKIGPDHVHGINDGRSRAIIAEAAVVMARRALGIEQMP